MSRASRAAFDIDVHRVIAQVPRVGSVNVADLFPELTPGDVVKAWHILLRHGQNYGDLHTYTADGIDYISLSDWLPPQGCSAIDSTEVFTQALWERLPADNSAIPLSTLVKSIPKHLRPLFGTDNMRFFAQHSDIFTMHRGTGLPNMVSRKGGECKWESVTKRELYSPTRRGVSMNEYYSQRLELMKGDSGNSPDQSNRFWEESSGGGRNETSERGGHHGGRGGRDGHSAGCGNHLPNDHDRGFSNNGPGGYGRAGDDFNGRSRSPQRFGQGSRRMTPPRRSGCGGGGNGGGYGGGRGYGGIRGFSGRGGGFGTRRSPQRFDRRSPSPRGRRY